MEKTIFTIIENCVACKSCEVACAIEHSQDKTLLGALSETPRPRPRVHVEAAGAYSYPSRCRHCEDAACITACPMGAMTRNAESNAVYVREERCIGCWMCVMACPFGAVTADPATGTALKCDRCPERSADGLDPACVAACPTHALIFATPDELARQRSQASALAAAGVAPARPAASVELWRSLKGGA